MEQKPPAEWQDRIVKDPQILAGKPVVKGTRISVELITNLLEGSHRGGYSIRLPAYHPRRHRSLPPLQSNWGKTLQLYLG